MSEWSKNQCVFFFESKISLKQIDFHAFLVSEMHSGQRTFSVLSGFLQLKQKAKGNYLQGLREYRVPVPVRLRLLNFQPLVGIIEKDSRKKNRKQL